MATTKASYSALKDYGFTPNSKAKKNTDVIIVVVVIAAVLILGGAAAIISYYYTRDKKELFLVSFANPKDYLVHTAEPSKSISDQAKPFIDEIKKRYGIEGLASLSEFQEAASSTASWCERGLIDTDFTDVYWIYNSKTASNVSSQKCVDTLTGTFRKETINGSPYGVEGFLVYAVKPKIAEPNFTLAGKEFVVKVPWNGSKWSLHS